MVGEQKGMRRFIDLFATALLFECTVKEPGYMLCVNTESLSRGKKDKKWRKCNVGMCKSAPPNAFLALHLQQ